jgi:hypothetical protein
VNDNIQPAGPPLSANWWQRFAGAAKRAPIGRDIIVAGATLAIGVHLAAPFPLGFKDQGRGPLTVLAFLVGAAFGCGFALLKAMCGAKNQLTDGRVCNERNYRCSELSSR